MKVSQTLAILLLSFPVSSQTPISGVINQYAKVLEINVCEGKLTLSGSASQFAEGDPVVLIQMKGATINASNSGNFGNVEDLGGAGVFERNEVKTVSGSELWLKNVVSQTFDAGGSVQLVSLPKFADAVVTDTLTAAAWNGSTGGVLAFEVENTLTLEAPLDVSGKGFRGGSISVVTSDCSFLSNADDYFYSPTNWRGSPKGEGVAAFLPGKEHGRGAQTNGGGGGNDHNSGGGGGGSPSGAGGIGGKQKGSSTFGCTGDYPGRGGKALPNLPGRIFLGGGGGAGHVDDDGAGSAGGNGGGIVLLLAKNIEANGQAIFANGVSPTLAVGDGAGGGGAGGGIFLQAENVQGSLFIEAKGGNGGNVVNEPSRCFGPGGGGSGGRLIANGNNFDSANLSGGVAGINTIASGQCDGESNGALAGADGILETEQQLPQNQVVYTPTSILAQPQSTFGCQGQQAVFEFQVQGIFLSYHWQTNTGNGWADLTPNPGLVGIFEPKLTITNPGVSLDGHQFRCRVTSPCEAEFFSETATLQVISPPEPSFNFSSAGNASVQFSNTSLDAQTYLWDFGDGTTDSEENPAHTFPSFGAFTVTLTATNDCGSVTFSQIVLVETLPQAGFAANIQAGCAPLTVIFQNQSSDNSTSFEWHFPGGSPATSTMQDPQVVFNQQGSFAATLIVKNSQGSDTLTFENFIQVNDVPQVSFTANVSNLEAQFLNFSTNATGGYGWDFGDGTTSDEASPTHTYSSGGFFNVTLTASNECGQASATQTISTGAFPQAGFDASTEGGCAPVIISFQNTSTGTNLTSFQWEFPGGNPSVSSQPNPVVTYGSPGIYDVKLTVANALGEHSLSKTGFVTVLESPEVAFSFLSDENTVSFANESTGWSQLHWDFGDGATSSEDDPTHTYSNSGIFTVTLTASNAFCGSALAQHVSVNSTGADEASPLFSLKIYPNPAAFFLRIERAEMLAEEVIFRLFDANGKLRLAGKLEEKMQEISLDGWADGLYLLEIEITNRRESPKCFTFTKL